MQREKQSSCQVPLALAILILVAAALCCFAGALALGIGAYYFIESETGGFAVVSPTPSLETKHKPEAQPTPGSPLATPTLSSTPFKSITPSTPPAPSTRSAELDEYGFHTAQIFLRRNEFRFG
jgi:hypothetical protein